MKIKKMILIIISFILIITLFFKLDNIIVSLENMIVKKEKNDFILETRNIMNIASNYFLRVLDPKIDKNDPVVGEVTIVELKSKNLLTDDVSINGKIRISILGDDTNYTIIVSNKKYYYSGNYDDFKFENINKK